MFCRTLFLINVLIFFRVALIRNPGGEMDKMINRLRLKHRTYTMDFEVDCVSILLFQYFFYV